MLTQSRRRRLALQCALVGAPLLFALALAGAPAAADCQPWVDRERVLLPGSYDLGQPFAARDPTLRALGDCFRSADGATIDCELIDADGLAYLYDQDGLIRIDAQRDRMRNTARLPLGLAFGDDRATVARKIAALPDAAPRQMLLRQSSTSAGAWASGFCVFAADSEAGSWYVEFDDQGRLQRVGLRANAG